ncbi:MAG: RNA-guided endonuclease TnpB family protein [Clostridium sp.]|nr:transposase [Clostridium sp.]MCE5220042.1 RNA-guided endonuclease TnpB family protein [Clostridium sp.]
MVPVNCNKSDYQYLMQCNKYSAIIWNKCVESDWEYRDIFDKSLTQSQLQFMMKKSVPHILANSINFVIIKYITARDAMWKSIMAKHENSNKVKLPYKEKKFFNTGWTYQNIRVYKDKGYLTLAKPVAPDIETNYSYKRQKPIKCHLKSIPNNIVEIELIYCNGLKLAIKTKEENNNVLIQSNNESAIDLGEIHSITAIDNNENAIIITGRKIRDIKRLRNKELGKLKSRQRKCTKGSKQYRKYSKAIWNLKYQTDKKILDAVHKTTKLYLDYCLQNNISIVYYGDLDDCTRNTKEEGRGSRKTRQKLSQWNYGLIILQLKNKLNRHGIELIKVKEYWTSKKCPCCGKRNTPKGRNYQCKKCGYIMHRDVNGAINILNDNSQYKYKVIKYSNLKYLRIA